MANFVIGYLNLHHGELQLDEVTAKDSYEALLEYLEIDSHTFKDLEAIYDYVANTDAYINILEL